MQHPYRTVIAPRDSELEELAKKESRVREGSSSSSNRNYPLLIFLQVPGLIFAPVHYIFNPKEYSGLGGLILVYAIVADVLLFLVANYVIKRYEIKNGWQKLFIFLLVWGALAYAYYATNLKRKKGALTEERIVGIIENRRG